MHYRDTSLLRLLCCCDLEWEWPLSGYRKGDGDILAKKTCQLTWLTLSASAKYFASSSPMKFCFNSRQVSVWIDWKSWCRIAGDLWSYLIDPQQVRQIFNISIRYAVVDQSESGHGLNEVTTVFTLSRRSSFLLDWLWVPQANIPLPYHLSHSNFVRSSSVSRRNEDDYIRSISDQSNILLNGSFERFKIESSCPSVFSSTCLWTPTPQ